jgi:hypothetical protein
MSKYKDLTGMTFGKLVVIEKNCQKSKSGDILWICSCICKNSNPILITSSHLTSGHTQVADATGKKLEVKAVKNITNLI